VGDEEDEELLFFRIFLTVLHAAPMENGVNVLGSGSDDPALRRLGMVVKYCLDLIQTPKLKGDFSVYMEKFTADYDPNMFLRFADFYLRYHEQFLFRVQVPLIINALASAEDVTVEKARGFSHEDDRNIISMIQSRGYDTFALRDKSREEVNQRVRKIISVLHHRQEMRDNDNMYLKTLLTFGRPTEKNEYAIERFLRRDPARLNEIVDRILSLSKRSRRDTAEMDVYERIVFFDRLDALSEIPTVRKSGMPRRWDAAKDSELREYLLTDGLVGVHEKFDITEDMAIRRFETIFKHCSIND
jgi:hypothetical protein